MTIGTPKSELPKGRTASTRIAGIMARLPPPLAQSTQANPDRDQRMIPLFDTGQLLRAISVKIDGKVHRV